MCSICILASKRRGWTIWLDCTALYSIKLKNKCEKSNYKCENILKKCWFCDNIVIIGLSMPNWFRVGLECIVSNSRRGK